MGRMEHETEGMSWNSIWYVFAEIIIEKFTQKRKKYYFTLLVFPFIFPNMHGNEWMNEWNEGKLQRRKNQIMAAYNRLGVCVKPILHINYPRAYWHRANLNMNWTLGKDLEVLTSSVWNCWDVVCGFVWIAVALRQPLCQFLSTWETLVSVRLKWESRS